jgi:hypothetical protein
MSNWKGRGRGVEGAWKGAHFLLGGDAVLGVVML